MVPSARSATNRLRLASRPGQRDQRGVRRPYSTGERRERRSQQEQSQPDLEDLHQVFVMTMSKMNRGGKIRGPESLGLRSP